MADRDAGRAFAAWGTSRPELSSELREQRDDRLVHRLACHASEFASTAWYVAGRVARALEGEPALEDEDVALPDGWEFSERVAQDLPSNPGRGSIA